MTPGRNLGYVAWAVSVAIMVYVAVVLEEMVLAWILVGLFVVWVASSRVVVKRAGARRRAEPEKNR